MKSKGKKASIKVALSGQPNCGKSTMFNVLTGSTARVGNYPGITVDRMDGVFHASDYDIKIIDLPGTYSLSSYSLEEVVARDVIINEKPDVIICMLDATSIERSLYLTVQLMELGIPVVVGLNMMDSARKNGVHIDSSKLSRLIGAPVVECVARRGTGKIELMHEVVKTYELQRNNKFKPLNISYGNELENILSEMVGRIEAEHFLTDKYPARWTAVKYIEEDSAVLKIGEINGAVHSELLEKVNAFKQHVQKSLDSYPEALIADYRYGFVNSLLKDIVFRKSNISYHLSDKIDKVLTQRFLGPVIMVGILYLMFYITFNLGAIPQGWVEGLFGWFADLAVRFIPEGLVQSLVVSGVIDGVGAVMGFAPLILIMFAMLVFLEDLGYMSRVAYMFDRLLRSFGLHGASVMPFILSGGIPGGCAVPGVMTARTLRSKKERLATIFTAPFFVCGAKITAFLVLCAAFFPDNGDTVMLVITLVSWVAALLVSWVLRKTVLTGESTPFIMELPPYRMPTFYGVAVHTLERVWQYVKKAGTVIFAISVLLWVLMTFPRLPAEINNKFDSELEQLSAQYSGGDLAEKTEAIQSERSEAALRYSVAGRIGTGMETVTRIAGFNWRVNIALFAGVAAKEVIVSTLSTAYSLGEADPDAISDGEDIGFIQRMRDDPSWTMPAVISVFVFMLLYCPCFVTIVVMARESSWSWALFACVTSLVGSFILSVIIYQAGTHLFG